MSDCQDGAGESDKIYKASAEVVNAFAKLDVAAMWGDGSTAAAPGALFPTAPV